jgi:hypothetical protein
VDYAVVSKVVPGVAIAAAGSPPLNTTTNSSGNYVLTGFGAGAYTVTPSRTAQPCLGTANGIFANDAALISQHVVQFITLSPDQLVAGNVSGSAPGTVTAQDAAFVAQKIVGNCSVNNQSGQWVFSPVNVAHPGGVAGQLVENYRAFLKGDVSGDWDPLGASRPGPKLGLFDLPAIASIPNVSAPAGSNVTLPLSLEGLGGASVNSYQFEVAYDPAVLTPQAAAATVQGTMSEGLNVVFNSTVPGVLKVAVYGAFPATGDGVYLDLNFKINGRGGSSTPLSISGFRFNDGKTQVNSQDGLLTVTANGKAIDKD